MKKATSFCMKNKILIIGNGIAGVTLAINLSKSSGFEVSLVSDENKYFYSRTALMYVYMGHLKFEHTQPYQNNFWKDNNINLIKATVIEINNLKNEVKTLNGETINYDYLVIATGSKPNKFNWPGQDLAGVSGFYHKKDLENLENLSPKINSAVIVGGGLIGIELAEMLKSRNKKVTFLVREPNFWSLVLSKKESEIIEKHIIKHQIDLKLATELKEIVGINGSVSNVKTSENEILDAQYVGLTVGVSPNIDWLKGSSIETNKGILVNKYLRTNIENIFAIGDCAEQKEPQPGRKAIEAVWYTGKIMGNTLSKTMMGEETEYQPGHWFNSAKFLDIEYQTYGNAPAVLTGNEKELFWSEKEKSIRIVYDHQTGKFLGVNALGIRLRQDFFEKILNNNLGVDFVIKNLKDANFDPEFYKNHLKNIKFQ